MIEDEARTWLERNFDREACDRVSRFIDLVRVENDEQNLISPTTVAEIWARHAVDSAQLLAMAPEDWESWIDIGTGGGFPGMVVALLAPERAVALVEPRRKRADFLQSCAQRLELEYVRVHVCKIEALVMNADVISARAVASIENLLQAARHCAKADTTWLLPRGRSGIAEAKTMKLKHTMFHVEHSLTDDGSAIVILNGDGT